MAKSIRSKSRRRARNAIRHLNKPSDADRIKRITALQTENLRGKLHYVDKRMLDSIKDQVNVVDEPVNNPKLMEIEDQSPLMDSKGKIPVWLSKKQRRECIKKHRQGKSRAKWCGKKRR